MESLHYLVASRPDILVSVCMCANFQVCPKESHLNTVKRIFKYFLGTVDLGLWYPNNASLYLIPYFDVDFVSSLTDKKITSETCHFLGSSLILW